MAGIFGGQKQDTPSNKSDPAAKQAAENEAARLRNARGYKSTYLSNMVQNNGGLKQTFGQ